jgi:hypothetical protein
MIIDNGLVLTIMLFIGSSFGWKNIFILRFVMMLYPYTLPSIDDVNTQRRSYEMKIEVIC